MAVVKSVKSIHHSGEHRYWSMDIPQRESRWLPVTMERIHRTADKDEARRVYLRKIQQTTNETKTKSQFAL